MPQENPPAEPSSPSSVPPSPVDRYHHGDASVLSAAGLPGTGNSLGEGMLAPGDTLPDIEPELLDTEALKVIRGLRADGFQAYLVGGCVRDLLVGMGPKDFDIATSAHPAEIRSVFRNCRLIGRRFRLAHVYFRGGKIIEVATFRKNPRPSEQAAVEEEAAQKAEADLEAERHAADPEVEVDTDVDVDAEVELAPDLLITEDNTFGIAEEDARRRDFTVNGLFYDVVLGRVLDHVDGLRDLRRKLIRTIGDPEVRMREDPVRLLRAVRFASKLGFDIEPVTYAACEGAVEDLPRCAPPRLLEEVFKILRAGASAPSFELLDALGATPVLLPALYAAMRAGGPTLVASRQQLLTQLDARVKSRGVLDDALLFAALLEPIARAQPATDASLEPIDVLLDELVRSSRLPRRIADRVRHLLAAQKTFSGERRRRRSLASFRRAPYFDDALTLFELRVAATGEGASMLDTWRAGGEVIPAETASTDVVPGEGDPKRKRRRKRRGRGGEAPANGEGAAPPGGSSDA